MSLFILAISGYVLYERSRKVKGERKLRAKISRDLHDEVGGLLTGISMQTDLLRLSDRQVNVQSIESIGQYSREAIQMMDDIVWAIDSSNNDESSLSDRMKLIATQLLDPMNSVVIFEMDPGDGRKMTQTVRQNLYLIFKEAIHNVCKHSDATFIRVGMRNVGGSIDLYVCDDGKNASKRNVVPSHNGQGLYNMKLRADQIGATLRYGFTENGYEVWVNVPNTSNKWMRRIKFWR